MNAPRLTGLLECPSYKGWIEFQYEPGDRITDLTKSIEDKWGKQAPEDHLLTMYPRSWAMFCEQKDGNYVSLRKDDEIPIEAPAEAFQVIDAEGFSGNAFHILESHPGLLDVFFLKNYWDIDGTTPVQPRQHYSMNLRFTRDYEIPTNEPYTVHLLALVAIVGG